MKNFLSLAPEIADALAEKRPVVALESTIISHGMPFPENFETAQKVEKTVRETGAIPATIAILNGKIQVGLSLEQLNFLAKAGQNAMKVSRRDLPFVLMKKTTGATTVASTMIAAAAAGIRVFATGGIGGVHRGAEKTMDVSADLQELARTSVAVVSAGAKAILDLRLTLEYLETFGVPVLGFRTSDLPAFYSSKSGFSVDFRMESALEIANFLTIKWLAGLSGGVLVANPIPEKMALPFEKMNLIIEKAIIEADKKGIRGKETTPFLLSKIKQMTEGESLESNIALVLNNARLGGEIACELSKNDRNEAF